jgi:hypothetical protein
MLADVQDSGERFAAVSLAVVLSDLRCIERKRFRTGLRYCARTVAAVEQIAASGAADPGSAREFEDTWGFVLMKLRRLRRTIRRARLGG